MADQDQRFRCFDCREDKLGHARLRRPAVAQIRLASGSQWFTCGQHALQHLHGTRLRGLRPASQALTAWGI